MKTKHIKFRVKFKGKGIVNFDNLNQKWIFFEDTNLKKRMFDKNDNVSYAKKSFYLDEDDNLKYKIKISSNCLTYGIFGKEMANYNSSIALDKVCLMSFIGSPDALIRGFCFLSKEESFKRKAAICLTDAEQTCNSVSYLEQFSRSGPKNKDHDVVDSSIFKKESVGDIEYESQGIIDLQQMRFISTDAVFDRLAFNPDDYSLFKRFLQSRMPSFNSELGYYKMTGSIFEVPEYGFKLSNDDILFLTRYYLQRVLELNITRKSGYVQTKSLQVKIVNDVINDSFENEEGWIDIKSLEDLNKINFSSDDFYEEINEEESKELRARIEAVYEERKKKDSADKAKKKEEKANKKNK